MDRTVTVRFFKVTKTHPAGPTFERALRDTFGLGGQAHERERQAHGRTLRLERLTDTRGFLAGEIVRKQTENIPPEASNAGLSPLAMQEGGGLGHCVAFRYDPRLEVIAIQFDNRGVSINLFLSYLKVVSPAADFMAEPLVRRDAWERYNRGLPRKIEMTIASPENLPAVEGQVGSVISSVKNLSEQSDGPVVTVSISMGQARGTLSKRMVDGVLQFFTRGAGAQEDVRKLRVRTSTEEGVDDVSFISEFIRKSDVLDIPDAPDQNYASRRKFVSDAFDEFYDDIRDIYGPQDVRPD